MEDLRKRANDLLCYYGKMQNRLVQAGLTDTGALVELFAQLHRGLEAISNEELDPAIEEVNRLVEALRKMQADLQVLKELKTRMSSLVSGIDPSDGGRSAGSGRQAA